MHDPALWWSRMNSQEALLELVLFFVCIAMAWLVVWGVRRVTSQWELSVLLGKKLLDGVLFPVLLLGMVFVMRAVWARSHPLWLFGACLFVFGRHSIGREGVAGYLQICRVGQAHRNQPLLASLGCCGSLAHRFAAAGA
jgi:hypothetical protein